MQHSNSEARFLFNNTENSPFYNRRDYNLLLSFLFCSNELINSVYLSTSENGVLKIFHLVISRFDILV